MLDQHSIAENPFCTRRIRPGAVEYRFAPGTKVEDLIDRLCANRWRGAILGSHGSGKSTLLACIIVALEHAGRKPVLFELHDAHRRLPHGWRAQIKSFAKTAPIVVIVDGYEQLSRASRILLRACCRIRGLGLLVTAHSPAGLPEIYRTSASLEMTSQIVRRLMHNQQLVIPDRVIADAFVRHDANVREVLFDLYDFFEQRRAATED